MFLIDECDVDNSEVCRFTWVIYWRKEKLSKNDYADRCSTCSDCLDSEIKSGNVSKRLKQKHRVC